MNKEIPASSRNIYQARIDSVLNYINLNLDAEINLDHLAQIAHFSPFHFHRIFSAFMGETPQQFLTRARVERAANLLLKNSSYSITEIAIYCGFASSSTFARAFKNHFGISASKYQNNRGVLLPTYKNKPEESVRSKQTYQVKIQNKPEFHIAYVSNLEGYDVELIRNAWKKLYTWAFSQDLVTQDTQTIGISFDDPLITPASKCRYYAGITIPDGIITIDPVGKMFIPAGKYATIQHTCHVNEVQQIFHYLYHEWLIDSGYIPANHPPFEIYFCTSEDEPDIHTLEVCIPIFPI
ncbi:MAG: GyrI-like domain-containing protein [Anaerolineaceae bacterium]|nr:GyrI-like domain-containing protein [Anaerolineaceae bacterium]